jgi:cell division protein FtsB
MRKHFSAVVFIFALALFCYTLFFSGARDNVGILAEQLKLQERERDEIDSRVKSLQRLVNGLEADPDFLERVAREDLKMLAQDEELLIFENR